MNNYAKTIIIGFVGKDSELTFLNDNKSVCAKFPVAVDESFKKKDGTEKQNVAEWYSVVFWGPGGQSVSPYIKKGSLILVEGKQRTETWADKTTGVKQFRTTLVASNVTLLDRKPAGPTTAGIVAEANQVANGEVNGNIDSSAKSQAQNYAKSEPAMVDGNSSFNDDTDLPF